MSFFNELKRRNVFRVGIAYAIVGWILAQIAEFAFSLLYLGGESAQMELGLPSAVTGIFQGVLLFFLLATDVFINFRVRLAAGAPLATGETAS